MNQIATVVLIITFLLSHIALANESAKDFFGNHVRLSDNFDSFVAELYSDNAKIHAYRKYPHSLERSMELRGVQWEQLIIRAMPLAKAQNDKSIFSPVTISNYGDGYKIKTERYSKQVPNRTFHSLTP